MLHCLEQYVNKAFSLLLLKIKDTCLTIPTKQATLKHYKLYKF